MLRPRCCVLSEGTAFKRLKRSPAGGAVRHGGCLTEVASYRLLYQLQANGDPAQGEFRRRTSRKHSAQGGPCYSGVRISIRTARSKRLLAQTKDSATPPAAPSGNLRSSVSALRATTARWGRTSACGRPGRGTRPTGYSTGRQKGLPTSLLPRSAQAYGRARISAHRPRR